MFDALTINVATEVFGMVFCLICLTISAFSPSPESIHSRVQWDIRGLFLCVTWLMFADAMAGIFKGHEGSLATLAVNAGNFVQFAASYMVFGFMLQMITHSVPTPKSVFYSRLGWGAVIINLLMMVWNLFSHEIYYIDSYNVYSRGRLFLLSQLSGVLCAFIAVVYLTHYHNSASRQTILMYCFTAATVIAALLVETHYYGIAFLNIAMLINTTVLFIYNQMSVAGSLAESEKKIAEQKLDLEQKRVQLMVSQIKPHFLFNTLTAIAELCDESPEKARETTISFANYLRKNMSSIDEVKPLPFDAELEHIKNYLMIESVRFGELLNVEYDIKARDFSVPVLSVQPIVENAVKHGVGQKPEGGTVRISTDEDDGFYIISVSDDGVGFDTSSERSERSIGIRNVETRLAILKGAEMSVESRPGEGTAVTIKIPKG